MSKFDEVFKVNSLTLNVTNQCNLKCEYCFEGNKSQDKMTSEEAVTIFDKAYNNFKANYPSWEDKFSVAFFGGEPFLNFEAMKAVMNYAYTNKYYDVSFGVTTNMTILTSEMIESISKYDLGIMISLDGLKEIHDKNRCNSYDKITSNIKLLQDAGLNYLLSARMTFTPNTVSTMTLGVLNVIENINIDVVHPYLTTDVHWNKNNLNEMKHEWEKLFDLQIKYFNLPKDNKRNISITPIISALTSYYSFDGNNIPCPFGGNTCVCVGCGGEIQPCHQRFTKSNLREELRTGNILNDEILTKRIMGGIEPFSWKPISKDYNCSTCNAINICKGCCPSEGIDVRDSFLGVPEVICFLNNTMMELINKRGKELLEAGSIRNTGIQAININIEVINRLIRLEQMDLNDPLFGINLSNLQSYIIENKKFMFLIVKTILADKFNSLNSLIKEV